MQKENTSFESMLHYMTSESIDNSFKEISLDLGRIICKI